MDTKIKPPNDTIRNRVFKHMIKNYRKSFTVKKLQSDLNLKERQVTKALEFLMNKKVIISIKNPQVSLYARYQLSNAEYKKVKKIAEHSRGSYLMDTDTKTDRMKNEYISRQKTKHEIKTPEFYILEELLKYDRPISDDRLIKVLPKVYSYRIWITTIHTMIKIGVINLVKQNGKKKVIIHPIKPQNFRERTPLL